MMRNWPRAGPARGTKARADSLPPNSGGSIAPYACCGVRGAADRAPSFASGTQLAKVGFENIELVSKVGSHWPRDAVTEQTAAANRFTA